MLEIVIRKCGIQLWGTSVTSPSTPSSHRPTPKILTPAVLTDCPPPTSMEKLKPKSTFSPFLPRPPKSKTHHQPKTLCCSQSPNPNKPSSSILWSIPDWADAVTERGMRKPRTLYTPDDWRQHRSTRRHLRHLLSSFSSRVILSLVPPVLSFTSFAAALSLYNSAVLYHWLPGWFPLLRASSLPYQLTAPALALLLVFRTEASYGRYAEGRRCWMRVLSGAAEMAGMVMNSGSDEGIRKAVLGYIMAFPVALKCHVISNSDVRADLWNLLEEDDIAVVISSKHRPRCLIEFITQSLQMLHWEDPKRNMLESKIGCFHEGIAICEQLMGIPIPLSYTRLTSRFLVLWHLTLPVILWDDCNWIVVPATFISAASLFCIEEVGVLIEEPFPMLALDELCNQLHDSIREAMAIQSSIHVRLAAKTKSHPVNGWPNS